MALGRLVAALDYTDIVDVVRSGLHDFLDAIQGKLNGVGKEITHTFFAQRWRGESLR
ncbi:MAG: alpha-E domain-containing protein [Acidobacteria bacterium]|nr:alpha-E domain-containing protein [Acidobacteriota bacterium]